MGATQLLHVGRRCVVDTSIPARSFPIWNFLRSSIAAAGPTVTEDGQLLLSRHPFRLHLHVFSRGKRGIFYPCHAQAEFMLLSNCGGCCTVIVGEFGVNKRTLFVPVLHLTSDHQGSIRWSLQVLSVACCSARLRSFVCQRALSCPLACCGLCCQFVAA